MDKSFWLEKWQANQIGFHLAEFHPLLQKYCAEIYTGTSSVFVPLCGKTNDMLFLQSQGFCVIGNELIDIAAQEFFADKNQNLQDAPEIQKIPEIVKQANFTSYRQQKVEILVGDFFDLSQALLSGFSGIYDRAALIALPKEIRGNYIAHLRQIVPKAKMLLITLDYDQQIMSGPPFSVDENEVNELFSFANIKLLHRRDIIEQEPHFKSKGLQCFYQTAYKIEW